MNNWPIGLSTGCFYRHSILECLELIRQSGFSMVEVCSSPAHLDYHDQGKIRSVARLIDDLGMEASSFHAPFADWIDISSPDPKLRAAAEQEILRAADAAAILAAQYFVIHPGPEHANLPPQDEQLRRMRNTVDTLNRVAHHCAKLGVRCVLENKLPHLLFGNTSDILWIMDAMEAGEVGACLDTGHGFLSGDLETLVRKLSGHLRLLHVHDNKGSRDDHLAPGDGKIDWARLLQCLETSNFQGPLILELAGEVSVEATMANARRGRTFLRRLARASTRDFSGVGLRLPSHGTS